MEPRELRFFNASGEIAKARNHLPHWQQPGATYSITFRLADSIPEALYRTWLSERDAWLKWHPKPWIADVEKEYHQRFSAQTDRWLDAGHGECVLRDERCREMVCETLRFRDGDEYFHHAWVVMPNHVHVLVTLHAKAKLEKVVGAWKSVSSRNISGLLRRNGAFWQADYFDRLIRDMEHFGNVARYIRTNPAKAKLTGGFTSFEAAQGAGAPPPRD